MSRVTGFAPVVHRDARVLILGSMPSVKSLERNEYYGNRQNKFWKIMGDLLSAGIELPYSERIEKMAGNGIILWDVLESCVRPGSMDSAIDESSAEPNDFPCFFREHASIRHVCFNGKAAARLFTQKVLPVVQDSFPGNSYRTLPSTSPAYASMSYPEKLEEWSVILRLLET
jgi:hypoxanthine-DNA glycosylase